DTYKVCFDEKCQIELGRELAANKTLATNVLNISDRCVVTARLYDLKTQTNDASASAEGACEAKEIMILIKKVSKQIQTQ
ncbi:MAG: hypothetical protein ACYTEQ_28350, partial [Planctomycetota bacterium]